MQRVREDSVLSHRERQNLSPAQVFDVCTLQADLGPTLMGVPVPWGPPPTGIELIVVNQSDKLLNKTVVSLYLNKYGLKRLARSVLGLKLQGSLEFVLKDCRLRRFSTFSSCCSIPPPGGLIHPHGMQPKLQLPLTLPADAPWPLCRPRDIY